MADESQLTFSDIGSDTDTGTYTAAVTLASELFDTEQQSITITTPNTSEEDEHLPTYIVKKPPDSKQIDVSEYPDATITSIQTEYQDSTVVLVTTITTDEYILEVIFPNEVVSEEETEDQNRMIYKQFKFKEFVDSYL